MVACLTPPLSGLRLLSTETAHRGGKHQTGRPLVMRIAYSLTTYGGDGAYAVSGSGFQNKRHASSWCGARSGLVVGSEEVLAGDPTLAADYSKSRPLDCWMVGKRQRSLAAVRIVSDHRDMSSFPHHDEAKSLRRLDDATLRGVNREQGHYTAASATKTSSTGVSARSDSGPKVSM